MQEEGGSVINTAAQDAQPAKKSAKKKGPKIPTVTEIVEKEGSTDSPAAAPAKENNTSAKADETASKETESPKTDSAASKETESPKTDSAASKETESPKAEEAASKETESPKADSAASKETESPKADEAANADSTTSKKNKSQKANDADSKQNEAPKADNANSKENDASTQNDAPKTNDAEPKQSEEPAEEKSEYPDEIEEEDEATARARANLNLDSETALIEAILFLESEPQNTENLAKISQLSEDVVKEALARLRENFANADSGIEIAEIIGGWMLVPKKESFDLVKEKYGKKNEGRLSKAAIETLSIIAYSQPITRAEIESIRHVNADNMMRILLDRHFIKEVGKKDIPGKPTTYGTTKEFLEFFHLQSIADLPQLDEKESERFELAR